MSSETLFSPFQLKNYTLKNRIGVAPMTRMSSVSDGVPRQDVLDFLVRRAENNAAIVYTEAIVTDYESAQGYPGQARITTQRQIETWQPVVRAIQQHGSIAILQMFHCGRMAWPEVNPARRIIGPSRLTPKQNNPLTGKPYSVPDEMSKFDIEHVINGFVETAKGAIAAGFDGIEIHGAHGYLINQFLSSYCNQRTDNYGGTIENRYRFAHEIIRAVRPVVPEDRLLTFRISDWGVADMEVSLYNSKEEYQQIIRMLSQEPIDAISVSTYDFTRKAFGTEQNMSQITSEVTDLPVMICGKIYDRASADKALENADVILSAKSMLLNPNWVADLKARKPMPEYTSEEANVAYTDTPLP
jgi:2,4-dienoyl-CoA reductase-like NADH-dependent reductase (Old Yellow Enzyme family)